MKPPMKNNARSDLQTPPEALGPLLPYLKRDWVIWECAAGVGTLVAELRRKGFKVIGSDIKDGYDFLSEGFPISLRQFLHLGIWILNSSSSLVFFCF